MLVVVERELEVIVGCKGMYGTRNRELSVMLPHRSDTIEYTVQFYSKLKHCVVERKFLYRKLMQNI